MEEESFHPFTEERLSGESLSRRHLIKLMGGGAAAAVLPACAPSRLERNARAALSEPLYYSSVRALAAGIRNGAVSAEETVRACLERIEAVNPQLNAVVQLQPEAALERARQADAASNAGESWGPLHGVPMTIKDSLDTADMITTGGTSGRASFVPERDATVVARLREAGAILLGKTNTPELTLSFETTNLVYGKTSNPYDLERTSGGSSGGAAAIVAAGGSPFDIGSDYGGSIRLPCHWCGLAGIKPSAGRVPRTGHIYPFGGLQDSFQQIGPIARTVDDLSLLLPLIMGPDWIDPAVAPLPWSEPERVDIEALRISFHTDNGIASPTRETIETIEAVAASLSEIGATVEEARPTGIEETLEVGLPLYFWDGGAAVRRLLAEAGTTETTLQDDFVGTPALSASALDQTIARWYGWRSRMHSFLSRFDVIVCPVNATPALPHGRAEGMENVPIYSYTVSYNLTGWPGVSVRAGASPEGLPIGVQIVARPGREDVALAVAKFVEAAHGGFQPPSL
jgi:amidase